MQILDFKIFGYLVGVLTLKFAKLTICGVLRIKRRVLL